MERNKNKLAEYPIRLVDLVPNTNAQLPSNNMTVIALNDYKVLRFIVSLTVQKHQPDASPHEVPDVLPRPPLL